MASKILRLFLIISLFLSLSGFSSLRPMAQDEDGVTVTITQVDTSQFPQVTMYVSAINAAGEPVGIDPSVISIRENGQEIAPDRIGGAGEVGPLTTLLVMDISGSMNTGGKLNAAKNAAQAYIEQMRTGDLAGLMSFNTAIKYVQPVTSDFGALSAAVEGLSAQDDTAMYDALVEAVEVMEVSAGRKAIIVLTDGLDNRSTSTVDDVLAKIGPAGLSISTIGLGDPTHGTGAQTALDEAALTSLAERAGGVYGYAENDDLSALYQLYGRTLQAEYQITYTSPSSLRDGVNRSLSVSLDGSSAASAQVGQTVYNPGGLVPEISEPAPWSLFITLLGVLLLLLLVPSTLRFALGRLSSSRKPKSRIKLSSPKSKPRIKLKD
jgi:Ca-activated chloride channel homolog